MAYNTSQPTTIPTIPQGQERTGYQSVRPVDVVDVPRCATDSELADDDVIIRYEGEEVVGMTILHASKR